MDMLSYFLGRLADGGTGDGGGVTYTSIVYNTDNTVTLTDKDGVVHTMSCTYEDGKLIGVTYDGKAVDLTYNGDTLVKVGKTAVDVGKAPLSDDGKNLLSKAQFTSNFKSGFENENHNEDYQLSFRSSLTSPTYCESGLDHTVGGYSFDYSEKWKNELLNYTESTIVALVKIVGSVDYSDQYDRQRLFDLFSSDTEQSSVGFGGGNLYKVVSQVTSSTPSTKTPIEYNKWYVVSLVFKNNKYYVYLDDTLVATSIIVDKENQDSLYYARFLNPKDWCNLNGYIGNLTYFNRALTSKELAILSAVLMKGVQI